MTDLRQMWDQAVQAGQDRRFISGRMGKADSSGTVSLLVSSRPNHLYVSLGPEGDQGVTTAINAGAPRIPWVPIRLRRERGQLYIEGLDYTPGRLEAFFNNQTAPGGVGFHNHRIGSGLEYEVEALRLEPGRCIPTTGMNVGVQPFRYFYNGAWDTWEGGSVIDLTAYKPASGKWAWVVVGVNPATNALAAAKGADQNAQTDLTVALIDGVSFGDYIPCGAVQVAEADTAVTDITRWRDAHGWVNMGPVDLGDLADVTVSSPTENDSFWYDGSGWVHGDGHRLNVAAAQALTVSSGALSIDATDAQHGLIDVRGEGDANDDLTTITGGQAGDVIVLHVADASTYGEITVKNSDNINVVTDVILDGDGDALVLVRTAAGWNPISVEAYGLTIDDLADVTITTPADNEVLAYDSSSGEWINQTAAEAGLGTVDALDDLSDVVITTPADNEVLAYDTTSGDWINQTAAEAGIGTVDAIDDLSDVVITTPADNEVLAYDSSSTDWINQTAAEAGLATASHNHDGERQNIGAAQEITISGGTADISGHATKPFFNIRGEGAAADDLDTLTATNSATGDVIYLTASTEVITVKDATGNIITDGDRTLNSEYDTLALRFDGTNWIEMTLGSPA